MEYETHISQYKDYLLARNKSQETIHAYTIAVKQFLQVISKQPNDITLSDLEQYTRYASKWSTNSKIPKYSAIKSFLYFCKYSHNNKLIDEINDLPKDDNPIRPPTKKPTSKEVMTKQEILSFLKISQNHPRNHAIIKTLYDSAQRKKSIIFLDVSDIDFEGTIDSEGNQRHLVKIRGAKKDMDYTILLEPSTISAIKYYLSIREKPKEGYVLDNYRRKHYHKDAVFLDGYGKRLHPNSINAMLKQYAIQLGIKKPVYPHLWRASACTIMDESGMSLSEIAEQSGHRNLASLQTYIRPDKTKTYNKKRRALSLDEPPHQPQPPQPQNTESTKESKPKKTPTDTYIASTDTSTEIRIKELELELLKLKTQSKPQSTDNSPIYG